MSVDRAKELYVPGIFSHAQVAKKLGVSASTVRRWLNPEEAERNRRRSREAKARRKRECACGASLSYDNERGLCTRCINAELHPKLWTQDAIIAAIQAWANAHGRPPSATDWKHAGDGHPAASSVYRSNHRSARFNAFSSWADAIEAAGFERPEVGGRYRERPWLWRFDHAEALRLLYDGHSQAEVARRLNAPTTAINRLANNGGTFAQRRNGAVQPSAEDGGKQSRETDLSES